MPIAVTHFIILQVSCNQLLANMNYDGFSCGQSVWRKFFCDWWTDYCLYLAVSFLLTMKPYSFSWLFTVLILIYKFYLPGIDVFLYKAEYDVIVIHQECELCSWIEYQLGTHKDLLVFTSIHIILCDEHSRSHCADYDLLSVYSKVWNCVSSLLIFYIKWVIKMTHLIFIRIFSLMFMECSNSLLFI